MALDSDFVNINFTSIADLGSVDTKINELESLKSLIADAVNNKLSNKEVTNTPDIDEKSAKYIEQVLASVHSVINSSDTDSSITEIDKLISQYGNLKVLEDLKVLYSNKSTMKEVIDFLQLAEQIERSIHAINFNELKEFEDILQNVATLKSMNKASSFENIIAQLTESLDTVTHERKDVLSESLSGILHKTNWLSIKERHKPIIPEDLKVISSNFEDLISLQSIFQKPEYPDSWWALDILLQPIITRFKYHFSSANKDTNKISKPQWAFNYMETFLTEELPYIELVIGGVLEKYSRITVYEVITAILQPIRSKVFDMIKVINENISSSHNQPEQLDKVGRVLSHLIYESTSFDQRLRNLYKFNPYIENFENVPTKKWLGITGDVLLYDKNEKGAVFNWLNFEYRLAKQRFDSEIAASGNALKIDFDFHEDDVKQTSTNINSYLKPTYSAYNLVKLFNNLTSHYKTLSIVKYQLKYVSNIQLKLIDNYFEFINKSFKNFNDSFNSSSVLNFIPGGLMNESEKTGSSELIKNGLSGLEILTGLYCLTKFIQNCLDDWSEELIFIQLWTTYQDITGNVDTNLTIFDSSIEQSGKILGKLETKYKDFFRKEIKNSLQDYVNSSQWNNKFSINNIEPSSSLSLLVLTLPVYLNYLKTCISDIDYFIITDMIVTILSRILQEYVITNNKFSRHGVEQIRTDFAFINDKLRDTLLLYPESDLLDSTQLSNISNKTYSKLQHSIDLLVKVDPIIAKSMKKDFEQIPQFRTQFDHGLSGLSDHEINDLLHRII